jgi:ankyrin repeat protein
MRGLFSDGEYLETRQFTVFHKMVLGLSSGSIAAQLDLSTASIDTTDSNGRTCLAWAALRGDVATVNTLLKYQANPRIADNEGRPPIFHAIDAKSAPIVAALIPGIIGHRSIDTFGSTALHIASAASDDTTVLEILVEDGHFDINAIDFHGDTVLNYAVRARRNKSVRYLLDHGADPNIVNVAGETALHMAIHRGAPRTLQALVKRGIDFSSVNSRRETILHAVVSKLEPSILESLASATPPRDIDGYTGFDRLKMDNHETATSQRTRAFQEFIAMLGRMGRPL